MLDRGDPVTEQYDLQWKKPTDATYKQVSNIHGKWVLAMEISAQSDATPLSLIVRCTPPVQSVSSEERLLSVTKGPVEGDILLTLDAAALATDAEYLSQVKLGSTVLQFFVHKVVRHPLAQGARFVLCSQGHANPEVCLNCESCGASLQGGASLTLCDNCKAMYASGVPACPYCPQSQRTCSMCGHSNVSDASYCVKCATKLAVASPFS